MDTTDRTHRLKLPYIANDQAQKHVTVNEGLRALDALVQPSVLSASVDAEPVAPAPGDAYVLTADRTGEAWTDMAENALAAFQDGAWTAIEPAIGMTAWVQDEMVHRVWNGAAWSPAAAGEGGGTAPQTSAPRFGVNASADETSRLVVKSDAVLHSHDDASGQGTGDVRHALNKSAPANTASLVFQTGYSGRAEMGLAGTDDFAFKVSADGADWRTAMTIDRATGAVALPNTVLGGASAAEVAVTAAAFAEGLRASLVASGGVAGGNPGLTRQVVMATETGRAVIGSAAANNLVEVYEDGAALAAGSVRERHFLGLGEARALTGLQAGAVIASTGGLGGVSQAPSGPMPLAPEAFAGVEFFLYFFRSGEAGTGKVRVASGAVPATARLLSGDGSVLHDQVALAAYSLGTLNTNGNEEYRLVADRPIFAAVEAGSEDYRLVPPLSSSLIGWARNGYCSALYPDTTVEWATQAGQRGSFAVSPGAAHRIDALGGVSDYRKAGAIILRANGPISAFSGADGSGNDATPFLPLDVLSQRVPLPLRLETSGAGRSNGIAVASPYEGDARLYAADGGLVATLPLRRAGPTASAADQDAPAAGLIAPDDPEADVAIAGFEGGYLEADVPVAVVQNSAAADAGGAGFSGAAKETAMIGVTPEERRAAVRRDEAGLLRRRRLDPSGAVSWPPC